MGPRPCAVLLVVPLAFRAPRGVLLGRAAWCARGRRPSCLCCLWPHGCSGRRRARPPARSPHASLRLGVVDLEARPCPPDPPAPSTPVVPGRCVCRCVAAFLLVLLVAPRVFRAPSGPAAREIATREPEGSEWSISKPARALRTLRHPPHQWCLVAVCAGGWRPAREPSPPRASLGALSRSPARPRRPSNFACNSLGRVSWSEV